jgi:Fe-S oxidoreductase
MFPEEDGERLSNIRVREAADTGAQTLATSCPFCIQNFGDSIKTVGNGLRVLDVAELLAKSVGNI